MITQKELAKRLGVSCSTISLALSGSSKVNDATRKKVVAAAEATGYRPNLNALALRRQSLRTIGVIFPNFFSPYYNELEFEIHPLLSKAGYTGFFFKVANQKDYRETVDELHGRGVDGIISGVDNPGALAPLCRQGVPVVIYHHPGGLPCGSVDVDREKGARMAGQHFINLGYRRLAYLGETKKGVEPRLLGFMSAIAEAGLGIPSEYIVEARSGLETGYQGMLQLLDLQNAPRAVLAFNDTIAIGAIRAIYDAGLRIPDDIAIIGFNNNRESQFCVPSLTTVAQPTKDIARYLVASLLDRISGRTEIRRIVLDPELIIRESCGAKQDS